MFLDAPRAAPDPRYLTGETRKGGFGVPPSGTAADLDLLQKRYAWSRQSKEAYHRTWATCLAFYVGEHYRQWHKTARRLVMPTRLPSWKVQTSENQIPGVVEAVAAKLTRSRQMPRAKPNTADEEDRLAAQAGTKALEHWWRVHGMDWKELQGNIQRIIFGACFYHDIWDPSWTARIPIVDPMTGRTTAHVAPVGDVLCEVLSVWDVFPEPTEDFDVISWCVIAKRMPLFWFSDHFGEEGRKVQSEGVDAESVFESLLPNTFSTDRNVAGVPQGEGSATLKICYERPCSKYPKGRHVMWAGNRILFSQDRLPSPHGEIPVTMSQYRYVPKRLWPCGLVEGLLGPQSELNRGLNHLSQNLRLHGNPQRLAPRECRIDPGAWSSEPNEILEYNEAPNTGGPRYLQPPNLPVWVQTWDEKKKQALHQLAGEGEVSANQVPPGVVAASAIRLIQEHDSSRLRVPSMLGAMALERLAKHVLITMVEMYQEPRLISTLGRMGAPEVQALMGADIGQRDVVVAVTEGMAETGAMKTETFFAWNSSGVFDKMFQGMYPENFVREVLNEIDEPWLLDALDAGMKEKKAMEQQQAEQQAQQQQQMSADQEGMMRGQAQQAMEQQAQQHIQQQFQADEADKARAHEMTKQILDHAAQDDREDRKFDGQMIMDRMKRSTERRQDKANQRERP